MDLYLLHCRPHIKKNVYSISYYKSIITSANFLISETDKRLMTDKTVRNRLRFGVNSIVA